jgi:ribonuclease VapC
MSRVVLDASAVLAYLWQEPGHEAVASVLEKSSGLISSVNLCEVLSKALDKGMDTKDLQGLTQALGLEVRAFDVEQSMLAAQLRKGTRHAGLSLGDRACLALAKSAQLVALTADRAWAECAELSIDIEYVR